MSKRKDLISRIEALEAASRFSERRVFRIIAHSEADEAEQLKGLKLGGNDLVISRRIVGTRKHGNAARA